jgi:hypothetical protein
LAALNQIELVIFSELAMTHEEYEIVLNFRNALDRMLTSASNPGRASAVLSDNTPGSSYHEMIMAKIAVDALLWDKPTVGGLSIRVLSDPKMPAGTVHFSCGPRPEQNVIVTGLAPQPSEGQN